jgi:hypothetical protein
VGDSRILRRRAQAILIELLPDHSSSFTYFRNLAKQSNHIYIPVIVSGGSASPLLCAPALVVCVCVCGGLTGELAVVMVVGWAGSVHVNVEKMKKVVDVAISIASSFNTQMGKE